MSALVERLRHQWGWDNSAAALRLEAADHIAELEAEIERLRDESEEVSWLRDEVERLKALNDTVMGDYLATAAASRIDELEAEVERLTLINKRMEATLVKQGEQYAAEAERLWKRIAAHEALSDALEEA
jgi:hypothetical protein